MSPPPEPPPSALRRRDVLGMAAAATGTAVAPSVAAASPRRLVVAEDGKPRAAIELAEGGGTWERAAAEDLARYIHLMSGATLPIVTPAAAGPGARLAVGRAAFDRDPSLRAALARAAKPRPVVQADAIAVRRAGDCICIAGANDESHYFAVSWLLQHWGCRWYLPTAFGEVVPERPTIAVDGLDHVYAPPFEVRQYWLAWNGDSTGADAFRHRNFMSSATVPGATQALDRYVADLVPAGGSALEVSLSAPATAEHVAARIAADYAAGKDISIAIADGIYRSAADLPLISEFDPHMLAPSVSDAMLALCNNVATILAKSYPDSRAKIGAMAYANATLPPRRITRAMPSVTLWLAAIDHDPNHAMDDPRSASAREYGDIVTAWSAVAPGRLVIYDYDQSMLVWRDLPNPTHDVFARNVKRYRKAGVLGIGTESRGAAATTFLNLFMRGQLMWDPDVDPERLLAEFYPGFYGAGGAAMARYWGMIFDAWRRTEVTEHEHFLIPAIYTPDLIAKLAIELASAEAAVAAAPASRASPLYGARMQFTRAGFEVMRGYADMIAAGAGACDYAKAAAAGGRALAARSALAAMNPTFTTHVVGPEAETADGGAAWFPGEVAQYAALGALTDGTKGVLVARLPLEWAFRIEAPLPADWTPVTEPNVAPFAPGRPGDAKPWRRVRTDLYLQAQGVRSESVVDAIGYYAYECEMTLDRASAALRILFPGLFNKAWLCLNDRLVATRDYEEPWWEGDYRFEWDVAVGKAMRAGANRIRLIGYNPHHFAGMFRRPFLYRPVGRPAPASAAAAAANSSR